MGRNTKCGGHLLYPEELSHTASPVGVNPTSQRGELSGIDSVGVCVEVVEEVDSLAVRVATDDDMLHVVEDAGQLEHGRLCGHTVGRDQGAGEGKYFPIMMRREDRLTANII